MAAATSKDMTALNLKMLSLATCPDLSRDSRDNVENNGES